MGTPDIMLDLKTVNVESRIIYTDWRVEYEPFVVYYDLSVEKEIRQQQKTINFVRRLKGIKPKKQKK